MPHDTFFRLPAEKQQRILDAAVQEFAQYAYKDASINRLIKAAGIPRGSFYQYFTDKEDLYRYLLEQLSASKLAFITASGMAEGAHTFAEYFLQSIASSLAWSEAQPAYFEISLHLAADNAPLLAELLANDTSKAYYAELERLLEQDKAAGRVRSDVDNEVLLETLNHIGFGLQQKYLAGWSSEQILTHFQSCFELLWRGLKPAGGDEHA